MGQIFNKERLSHPVQCETDPCGSGGVVVYGADTYTRPSGQVTHEEGFPRPVQCETDPCGSGGVVVYGAETYTRPSDENHQPLNGASSVERVEQQQ